MGAGESTAASCSSLDLTRGGQVGAGAKSHHYRRNRQQQLLHEQKLHNRYVQKTQALEARSHHLKQSSSHFDLASVGLLEEHEEDIRRNSMSLASHSNNLDTVQAYKLTNADVHGISRAQVMGKPVPMPGLHLASAAKKSNAGVASRILQQRQQQRFCELKKFSDSLPSLNNPDMNMLIHSKQTRYETDHKTRHNINSSHQSRSSVQSGNHIMLARRQSSQQASFMLEHQLRNHDLKTKQHRERIILANSNLVMNRASGSYERQNWQSNYCHDDHASVCGHEQGANEPTTKLIGDPLLGHHQAREEARYNCSNNIKRAISASSLHNLNQSESQLNYRHNHRHRLQPNHQNWPHQGRPRNIVQSNMVNPLAFPTNSRNEFDILVAGSPDANNERLLAAAAAATRPCHQRPVKSPQLAPPTAALASSYCRPADSSNCALSRQTGAIRRDLVQQSHHLLNCTPNGGHQKPAAPLPPTPPTTRQQQQQYQQINQQLKKNYKYKQIASSSAQSAKNNRYSKCKLHNQREQQPSSSPIQQQGCPVLPPLPRSQSLHELVQLRPTENGQRMRTTGTLRNPSGLSEQAGKVNLVSELLEKRRHEREELAPSDEDAKVNQIAGDIKRINKSETMLSQSSSTDDGIHDVSLVGGTTQHSTSESRSRQGLSSSNEANPVSSREESGAQEPKASIFKKQQVAPSSEQKRFNKCVARKSSETSDQLKSEPARSSAQRDSKRSRKQHKSTLIRSVSHSALQSVGLSGKLRDSTSHSQDGDESDDLNELAQFLYKFKHRQLQAKASPSATELELHKLKDKDERAHHRMPNSQAGDNLQQSPSSTTSSSGFASSTCTSKSVSSSEGGNTDKRDQLGLRAPARPSHKKYPAPRRPDEAPSNRPSSDSNKTKKCIKSNHASSLLSIVDEYQANLSHENPIVDDNYERKKEQFEQLQRYAQSRQISQSELALNHLTSSPCLLDKPRARAKSKCKHVDCSASSCGSESSSKPHKPYANRLLNLIRRRVTSDKSEPANRSSNESERSSSSADSAGGHFHQINRGGCESAPSEAINQIAFNISYSCSSQADRLGPSSSRGQAAVGQRKPFGKTPNSVGLRKCSAISESLCDLNFDCDLELIKGCGQLAGERSSSGRNNARTGKHQASSRGVGSTVGVAASQAGNINQPLMSSRLKAVSVSEKRPAPINNSSSSSAPGGEHNWRLAPASGLIGLASDERRSYVFNHEPPRAESGSRGKNQCALSVKSFGSLNNKAESACGSSGARKQTKPAANGQQCDQHQHSQPVRKSKWSASAWLLGGGGVSKKKNEPLSDGRDEIRQPSGKSYLAQLISNRGTSGSRLGAGGGLDDGSRLRDNNTDCESAASRAQNDLINEADQLLSELDHSLDMVSASADRARSQAPNRTLPWWRQVSSESGCKEALEQVSQIDAFRDGVPLVSDDSDIEADREANASDDGDYASLNQALINETFGLDLDQQRELAVEPAGSPSNSFTFSALSSPSLAPGDPRLVEPLSVELGAVSPPPPQIARQNIHLELERLKNGAPACRNNLADRTRPDNTCENKHSSLDKRPMLNDREIRNATGAQLNGNDLDAKRNHDGVAEPRDANRNLDNSSSRFAPSGGQQAHNATNKSESKPGRTQKMFAEMPAKGANSGKSQQQAGKSNNSRTFTKPQPTHNSAAPPVSRAPDRSSDGNVQPVKSTAMSAGEEELAVGGAQAQQAARSGSKGCCVPACSADETCRKIPSCDLMNSKLSTHHAAQSNTSNVQRRDSNVTQQQTVEDYQSNGSWERVSDSKLLSVATHKCPSGVKAHGVEQRADQEKLENSIIHSVDSIHGHSTCCVCLCQYKCSDLTTGSDPRQQASQKQVLCANNASSACQQCTLTVSNSECCERQRSFAATKSMALQKSPMPVASISSNKDGDKLACSCCKERKVLCCKTANVDAAKSNPSPVGKKNGRHCLEDDKLISQCGACECSSTRPLVPSAQHKLIVTAGCVDKASSNGCASDKTTSAPAEQKMMRAVWTDLGRDVAAAKSSPAVTYYHYSQELGKVPLPATEELLVGRESSQAKTNDCRSSGSRHFFVDNHNDDYIPSEPSDCSRHSSGRNHLTPPQSSDCNACAKNNARALHTNHHAKCHASGAFEMPELGVAKACGAGAPSTTCQDNDLDFRRCAPLLDHRQSSVVNRESGALPPPERRVAAALTKFQDPIRLEGGGSALPGSRCNPICRSNSELAVPLDQPDKSKRARAGAAQAKHNLLFGRLRSSLLDQKGTGEPVLDVASAKSDSSQLSLAMNYHESSHLAAAMLMANCKQQRPDKSGRNSAANDFDDNFILRRKTPNAGLKARC